MKPPDRRPWRLAAWTGLVLAAAAILDAAGDTLTTPSVTSPAAWPAWLAGHDPVVAGFAVARLAGLAVAGYLLAVTMAGVVVRALHAARLTALVDRATVPGVRRLLATTMSVSLAAGSLGAQSAGAQSAAPPPTVTMHRLPDAGSDPPLAADPVPTDPDPDESSPSPAPPGPDRWEVAAGECLWSISEAVLARAWGRPPTDEEIVPHWRSLIDANRHALADPDNPDLIYPGQVFTVPAPGAGTPGLAATL